MGSVTITVRVAWWVRWYVASVALTSRLTGMEPHMEKVAVANTAFAAKVVA